MNYYNILNNGATKTLTYKELQERQWQEGNMRDYYDMTFEEGWPHVYHTHGAANGRFMFGYGERLKSMFDNFHEYWDYLVYIYRNPFDTMISYYHYQMKRDIPWNNSPKLAHVMEQMETLEGFTEYMLPIWIEHVSTTKHLADLVMDYDELNIDPLGYLDLMNLITDDVDLGVLERAIEMSSFESIRKMGIETNRVHGLGGPGVEFTRDGRSGQYKEVMDKELIEYIRNECKKRGIDV